MSIEDKRVLARVTGRVQGVGFRHFTVGQARRLGLSGSVKNEPDGTVTAVAEGPEDVLATFVSYLRMGPRSAKVTDVSVTWGETRREHTGFGVEI